MSRPSSTLYCAPRVPPGCVQQNDHGGSKNHLFGATGRVRPIAPIGYDRRAGKSHPVGGADAEQAEAGRERGLHGGDEREPRALERGVVADHAERPVAVAERVPAREVAGERQQVVADDVRLAGVGGADDDLRQVEQPPRDRPLGVVRERARSRRRRSPVTRSPALRAIEAQRAWLYWRYGPESPSSEIDLLDARSRRPSRAARRGCANTTAPMPTVRATSSTSAGGRSGLASAIFSRTSSCDDVEHVAHQDDVAEPRRRPSCRRSRTRPYGTCSQRAAQAWPALLEQLEQLAEVQGLLALDDVERASEVIRAPSGTRPPRRRASRRAWCRPPCAGGSASSRRRARRPARPRSR